jgi:excisionase family DNA binding protein
MNSGERKTVKEIAYLMSVREFISGTEAAGLLFISQETLRRWTDQGKLSSVTSIRTPGGHRRWDKNAILAYARQQEQAIYEGQSTTEIWQGKIDAHSNGTEVWHEVTYQREEVLPSHVAVHEALAQGKNFINGSSVFVDYNKKTKEYLAHSSYSSSGVKREEVEADINEALPKVLAKMEALIVRRHVTCFISPKGEVFKPGSYHISLSS